MQRNLPGTPVKRLLLVVVHVLAAALLIGAQGAPAVQTAQGAPAAQTPQDGLRVAVLVPSSCDDLSWSQAMCEGLHAASERHSIRLTVRDNVNEAAAAEAALRRFAEEGNEIVIAHGTQFQGLVDKLAPLFPKTSFVYGSGDLIMHPNVFAYDPQPQEGAYLMGMAAGLISKSNILALVSPVDVSDAVTFNRGFELGVKATNPKAVVGITYIGLFDELNTSRTLAQAHIEAGADILSGTGQQARGALEAMRLAPGVFWMANDYNMSGAAPDKILAAQSYDYTDTLLQILKLRENGVKGGQVFPLSLSKGNINLVWSNEMPVELRQRMKKLEADIRSGVFEPDIKVLRYNLWLQEKK